VPAHVGLSRRPTAIEGWASCSSRGRAPASAMPGMLDDAAQELHDELSGDERGVLGRDIQHRIDLDEVEAHHLGVARDGNERLAQLLVTRNQSLGIVSRAATLPTAHAAREGPTPTNRVRSCWPGNSQRDHVAGKPARSYRIDPVRQREHRRAPARELLCVLGVAGRAHRFDGFYQGAQVGSATPLVRLVEQVIDPLRFELRQAVAFATLFLLFEPTRIGASDEGQSPEHKPPRRHRLRTP
jgi:hypothetical protein